MRRRSKRGPNNSESTGKIGQEFPTDQPAPLQPAYPEHSRGLPARQPTETGSAGDEAEYRTPAHKAVPQTRGEETEAQESAAAPSGAESVRPATHRVETNDPAAQGNLVVETQPESPSTPPPEPQAANPKHLKGYVVLAIGLPGSGKTTWFKRRGVTPLSSDMLRSILFDDIAEQRYQGLVFSTLRSLLRARLIAKMPWNYVDATNLSPHERRQWIKMAQSFGYDVQAVFFDVPVEICLERNRKRERVVNEESMLKMAERLRPPSFKEGFSKITMVRVKGGGVAAKPEEGTANPE
jgi:predicted kinase